MAANNYELIIMHVELLNREKERLQGLKSDSVFSMVGTLFNVYCSQDDITAAIESIENSVECLNTIINLKEFNGSGKELDYLYSLTEQEIKEDITKKKLSLEKTNVLKVLEKAKSVAFGKDSHISIKKAVLP